MAHSSPANPPAPDESAAPVRPSHLYGALIFCGVAMMALLAIAAHFYYFYSLRQVH